MIAGLIGCGRWGMNIKRELEKIGIEVFSVDPRIEVGSYSFSDIIILADFIFIASPSNLHYLQVKTVLESGKDVYCTKPICLKWKEALELQELATRHKLILNGGYIFREATVAKDFLKVSSDQESPIEMIFKNTKGPRGDSSIIFNLMIHFIDLAVLSKGFLEGFYTCDWDLRIAHLRLSSLRSPAYIDINVECDALEKKREIHTLNQTFTFDNSENTLGLSLNNFLNNVRERNLAPENLLSIKYCEQIERFREGYLIE